MMEIFAIVLAITPVAAQVTMIAMRVLPVAA
jgi:hypothetical protein